MTGDRTQTRQLPAGFGGRWVEEMLVVFAGEAARLGDLDRQAGDGDFGNNLTSAFRRVEGEIEQTSPSGFADWLTAVSRGFLGTGGTSGPLFGMFFRELSRCATDVEPTVDELAAGLAAGLATVQRYGKAKVGDKTMVDALEPAVVSLESPAGADAITGERLAGAVDAARAGAESTAGLVGRKGRASYVGEAARGVADPGAMAVVLILESAQRAARTEA